MLFTSGTTGNKKLVPLYGMTECLPISSPPANYDLSIPATSGVPVGPEVAILRRKRARKRTHDTVITPSNVIC